MMDTQPQPPESVPNYIDDGLSCQDAETLREIAVYAERLADWEEAQAAAELEEAAVEDDEIPAEDVPEDVPPKACLVVKEINDNKYYYWQWRDGDTVCSKYKAPVEPDE